VKGDLVIVDNKKEREMKLDSYILLFFAAIILGLWFIFKYKAIRSIEREKFMIKDPDANPDTFANNLMISIGYAYLFKETALNFTLHIIFVLLAEISSPVFHTLH